MNSLMTRSLVLLFVFALTPAARAQLAPVSKYVPLTLFQQYLQSDFVVVGHMGENLVKVHGVELVVDEVVKKHDAIDVGPKSDVRAKDRFLVFGHARLGTDQFDYLRSVELDARGARVKEYLMGAIKLKDKKARYRYWLDHMDNPDEMIAADAYQEFAGMPSRELAAVARELPAGKIAGWLRDPKTAADRCQVYGVMLGGCGTAEHGPLLRSKAAELARTQHCLIWGLLHGYIMVQPKEGWAYVNSLLADGTQPHLVRRCALWTAAFVHLDRPELVEAKEVLKGVSHLLEQPDMAERAVEFLRHIRAWDRTEHVLALYANGRYKRFELADGSAVVRFAMQSPDSAALAFVMELRTRQPAVIASAELRLAQPLSLAAYLDPSADEPTLPKPGSPAGR